MGLAFPPKEGLTHPPLNRHLRIPTSEDAGHHLSSSSSSPQVFGVVPAHKPCREGGLQLPHTAASPQFCSMTDKCQPVWSWAWLSVAPCWVRMCFRMCSSCDSSPVPPGTTCRNKRKGKMKGELSSSLQQDFFFKPNSARCLCWFSSPLFSVSAGNGGNFLLER